MDVTLSDESV